MAPRNVNSDDDDKDKRHPVAARDFLVSDGSRVTEHLADGPDDPEDLDHDEEETPR